MANLIDTALDRTIVLGYGNPGLAIRRRLADWPADPPRLDGRTVLVTGAASGIGLAACLGFARLGARVLAVGRNEARAGDAVRQIRAAVPDGDIKPVACDVSDLRALRRLAEQLTTNETRLDVLVNNAGVMPDRRESSADGHELMFATHVLAPFALTAWLRELLERSAPARVLNVSSGGMYTQALPGKDPESEQIPYRPKVIYARTKRQQVVISEEWAARLDPKAVVVHAMHPGWADTPGVRRWMPVFRVLTSPIIRDAERGADTIVWLGGAPQALETTGGFWQDRRPRPTRYLRGPESGTAADRRALWDYCQAAIDAVQR